MIKNGKLLNSEVRIETCSKCNAHCVICPRDKMTRPKVVMNNAHFEALLEQCRNLGATAISLFGYGEPFLDKDLLVKLARCEGLETHLTTNASLLDIGKAKVIIDNRLVTHMRFSVHALTTRQYESVHRGLKWDTTRRNIFNFLAINKNAGKPIATHMTVIPMAEERLEDIRRVWEGNVDFLEVWRPHNWVYGKNFRDTHASGPKKRTCGRPASGPIQINADGKMMVCCFDFDAKLAIGDTYKESIKQILETSKRFKLIQKAHERGALGGLPCALCDQINEGDEPLLYSNRDPSREVGKTSSMKFKLEG